MTEYFVFDKSVPEDRSNTWNDEKEAQSREDGKRLRDYFTALAKAEGLEKSVQIGLNGIGFAPPLIQVFTNEATAEKLEKASNGRLFFSKLQLNS